MPDAHVEMLLDCYKLVQEERTLDSGRLGKGAFHQVKFQKTTFYKNWKPNNLNKGYLIGDIKIPRRPLSLKNFKNQDRF